jgi:hypothetical protein
MMRPEASLGVENAHSIQAQALAAVIGFGQDSGRGR